MHSQFLRVNEATTLEALTQAASDLGANIEIWTNDKRVFVDAPIGKSWQSTGAHTLSERLRNADKLLADMETGLQDCDEFCVHGSDHWIPMGKRELISLSPNQNRRSA